MFAVPGWSLSPALLKRQDFTAIPKDPSEKPSKTSRKRKRQGDGAEKVTNSNVADLWNEHIGGINPVKKPATVATDGGPTDSVEVSQDFTVKDVAKTEAEAARQKERSAKRREKTKKREAQRAKTKLAAEEVSTTAVNDSSSKTDSKPSATPPAPAPSAQATAIPKLTPLQTAMRQKLISARFRHLNQTLYTAASTESRTLFETNPTFFEEYHSGFRQQVSSWPSNPVDRFVEELLSRGKVKDHGKSKSRALKPDEEGKIPLPRSRFNDGECVVADLGCGDAKLSEMIAASAKKVNIRVLSYDLQSPNSLVTKADIANLPLKDSSVNVTIFCLALMGTNWIDFIEEAWRILHWKGELWVAEIKSRFGRPAANQKFVVEHSVGNKRRKPTKVQEKKKKDAEEETSNETLAVEVDGVSKAEQTNVSAFVGVLRKRGFELTGERNVDLSNKMFVKMRFIKTLNPVVGKNVMEEEEGRAGQKRQKSAFMEKGKVEEDVDETTVLKPCLYKVR